MTHPKMRYTYVGIDNHKETHTAVFLDCFFEKLGEITFDNLPDSFDAFIQNAQKFKVDGTTFLFGLEDVSAYGRMLAVYLKNNNHSVKHVNALLVAQERKIANIVQKSDSIDAECAARVLLSKLGKLPDAAPKDDYWILRTLVMRRQSIVRQNVSLKNHLQCLLTQHYPNHQHFFSDIACDTSLTFFKHYPSPGLLKNTTVEELADFLRVPSRGKLGMEKAQEILDNIQIPDIEFQDIRDLAVQSAIRQIEFNLQEIEKLETAIVKVYSRFNTTLTSMTGLDVVSASHLLSAIGDIRRFPTPSKLARYSGIAPIPYNSGKTKDLLFSNQYGNRELNSLFHRLATRVTNVVGPNKKALNPFFYHYHQRKLSEGKTNRQALKCVQRRLVNIIWSMLTNCEEYINPPMINLPKETESEAVKPNAKGK